LGAALGWLLVELQRRAPSFHLCGPCEPTFLSSLWTLRGSPALGATSGCNRGVVRITGRGVMRRQNKRVWPFNTESLIRHSHGRRLLRFFVPSLPRFAQSLKPLAASIETLRIWNRAGGAMETSRIWRGAGRKSQLRHLAFCHRRQGCRT